MAKKLWHSRFSHVLSHQSKSFFFFSVSVREIYPRLIACDVIMPALTTLTMSRISTTNFTCFRVLQSNEPKTIASILSKIAIGNGTKLKRARCSTIWMIQLCEGSDTIASSIFSERNEKCRLRTFKLFFFFFSVVLFSFVTFIISSNGWCQARAWVWVGIFIRDFDFVRVFLTKMAFQCDEALDKKH